MKRHGLEIRLGMSMVGGGMATSVGERAWQAWQVFSYRENQHPI